VEGTAPVNEFRFSLRAVNDVTLPREEGRLPTIRLSYNSIVFKSLIIQIVDGRVPVRELEKADRVTIWLASPIVDGIEPVRRF
jgi:hypothetical protein